MINGYEISDCYSQRPLRYSYQAACLEQFFDLRVAEAAYRPRWRVVPGENIASTNMPARGTISERFSQKCGSLLYGALFYDYTSSAPQDFSVDLVVCGQRYSDRPVSAVQFSGAGGRTFTVPYTIDQNLQWPLIFLFPELWPVTDGDIEVTLSLDTNVSEARRIQFILFFAEPCGSEQ